MIDFVVGILVLSGGLFAFVAGLGVLRLPDVMIRMHASTKVGTLACGLVMLGVILHFQETSLVLRAVAIVGFLLLTAPIGAHMIGRAAIRTGVPLWKPDDASDQDTGS
ncbi:MAG: monovalent cation/H(+) antiporter subunit G [Pseudomonadota bacterium]